MNSIWIQLPISDLQPMESTTDDIIISGNVLVLLQSLGGVSCGGCCSGCKKGVVMRKVLPMTLHFVVWIQKNAPPVTSSNLTNHENIRILLREPPKEWKTRNSQNDS